MSDFSDHEILSGNFRRMPPYAANSIFFATKTGSLLSSSYVPPLLELLAI
jgi:hypothetical protein